MDDFARAREISATFEMSPYIWYPNPIIPDIAKAVGPERMKRWTPVKDAIDSGALVVPGSDWAVVPSVNPWIAVETLVTRQAPGGRGEALGEAEKITLEQAIGLFTVNSARLMGDRSRTGSIEKGIARGPGGARPESVQDSNLSGARDARADDGDQRRGRVRVKTLTRAVRAGRACRSLAGKHGPRGLTQKIVQAGESLQNRLDLFTGQAHVLPGRGN